MSAFVCGLDVHKESTYATILGPDGEVVAHRRMPNENHFTHEYKIRLSGKTWLVTRT